MYRTLQLLAVVAASVFLLASASTQNGGKRFTDVVTACTEQSNNDAFNHQCFFWQCVASEYPFLAKSAQAACRVDESATSSPLVSLEEDGVVGGAPVMSPCLNHSKIHRWSTQAKQHWLLQVAMDIYNNRAHEHYTENMTLRWVGINDHICPPQVPPTSDCSSTVTWIYWTLFGNGTDFLNGESWEAGYTGSLKVHGVQVNATVENLQVGDLCFYYHPMRHVAIYVGGGKVVSHGMDPVGYYDLHYAPLDYCRRYL